MATASREQRAADLIDDAADLIERHGWVQGRSGLPEIGFCMFGALRNGVWWGIEIYQAADKALCKAVGDQNYINWNDTEGRTVTQVLDAMRAAAKDLRR